MKYQDYLLTEDWRIKREEKLRGNPVCFFCGFPKYLNVHHVQYRHWNDVTMDDLRVLCNRCHAKVHAILKAHPEWNFPSVEAWNKTSSEMESKLIRSEKHRHEIIHQLSIYRNKKLRSQQRKALIKQAKRGMLNGWHHRPCGQPGRKWISMTELNRRRQERQAMFDECRRLPTSTS